MFVTLMECVAFDKSRRTLAALFEGSVAARQSATSHPASQLATRTANSAKQSAAELEFVSRHEKLSRSGRPTLIPPRRAQSERSEEPQRSELSNDSVECGKAIFDRLVNFLLDHSDFAVVEFDRQQSLAHWSLRFRLHGPILDLDHGRKYPFVG